MIPQQCLVTQPPDQASQPAELRWSSGLAQPGLNRAVRVKARPSESNR